MACGFMISLQNMKRFGSAFVLGSCLLSHPGFAMDIIAHRGASHAAPENTLSAFKQAWQEGAEGIEGDFYLTADERIVCIHDRNTKKLAQQDLDVTRSTLAELKQLDVGSWKNERFSGEQIPTQEDVLATIPPGGKIFIEIKDSERIVSPLKQVLEKAPVQAEQVRVIAFSMEVIRACRAQLPEIQASWLVDKKYLDRETLPGVLATARAGHVKGIGLQAGDHIDVALVKGIHDAGIELHTWTTNSGKAARRYRALGLKSVTTDKPGYIRDELK
jgi:glycerophosphoryl diester phosphodiesterase